MNISGKWKYIGLDGKNKLYGLSVRQVKRIARDFLISAIRIANGGIGYMDEKMIKQIVSDCGYQALGLYSYLFSARNIIDVTEITIEEIAHAGDYFDYSELIEDIKLLAEFGYILSDGDIYFFPKSIDYMNMFQKFKEGTDN